MRSIFLYTVLLVISLSFISYSSEREPFKDVDCVWAWDDCADISFSVVSKETYENLVGDDKLYHPDSIWITTMNDVRLGVRSFLLGGTWPELLFSVYDELYCFNQCTLDSTFTRDYFLHLGQIDVDTISITFPAFDNEKIVKFNGEDTDVPEDADEVGRGSLYWFFK